MKPDRFDLIIGYDGACPLCNRFIRWVIRSDRSGRVGISPLDGPTMRAIFFRHPALAGSDSVVVVTWSPAGEELVETGPDAVLKVAEQLNGWWRLLRVGRWLPGFINRWMYRLIARNRYRFVHGQPSCPLPDTTFRSRFV